MNLAPPNSGLKKNKLTRSQTRKSNINQEDCLIRSSSRRLRIDSGQPNRIRASFGFFSRNRYAKYIASGSKPIISNCLNISSSE